jgi:hypothetical protein
MEFVCSPNKKLNEMNEDYDVEVLWYGFKNLAKNYFNYLIFDDTNIVDYMNIRSNMLNMHQENKDFDKIYDEIYNYLIKFFKSYITYYQNKKNFNSTDVYNYNLVETWLNRYNKIEYVKKIKLDDNYKKYKKLKDIDSVSLLIIKSEILGIIFKENYCLEVLDVFDLNLVEFLDIIIKDNLGKIFDLLSTRYNLQDYYDYKNIDLKYTVIKYIKFNKLIKKCVKCTI